MSRWAFSLWFLHAGCLFQSRQPAALTGRIRGTVCVAVLGVSRQNPGHTEPGGVFLSHHSFPPSVCCDSLFCFVCFTSSTCSCSRLQARALRSPNVSAVLLSVLFRVSRMRTSLTGKDRSRFPVTKPEVFSFAVRTTAAGFLPSRTPSVKSSSESLF